MAHPDLVTSLLSGGGVTFASCIKKKMRLISLLTVTNHTADMEKKKSGGRKMYGRDLADGRCHAKDPNHELHEAGSSVFVS